MPSWASSATAMRTESPRGQSSTALCSALDTRLRPLSPKNLRMRGASQFAIVCKPAPPGALIVCDLGVRARAVLDALPTCFIDYHYFSDAPLNGMVITGFQAEPCPTSGLIAFWCANAIADVSDLEWIAAISLLSDVGERAPFAELTSAKNAHGLSALREATTLLTAARRPSSGNAEPALRLPLRASSPRGISRGHSPDAMVLRQAQQEVNRAYTEAKRARRNSAGAWRLSASTRRVRSTRLSRKSGELGYPITFSSARTPVTAMGLCISADAAAETDLIAFLRDHAP